MNRADLRTLVLRELQDPTATYWTTTTVNDFLNEALQQFCRETRCLRAQAAVNVVAQQAEYDLSSLSPRVFEILAVACPQSAAITSPIALRYMTWEEIEAQDTLWRTRTGNPRAYLRYNEGPLKVRLYPRPDTSYSSLVAAPAVGFSAYYGITGSVSNLTDAQWNSYYGLVSGTGVVYGALTIDYVADADEMTSDSESPDIPPEYHNALRDYAVARCHLMDTALSAPNKSEVYMASYRASVDQMKRMTAGGYQNKPPRSVSVREF